MLCFEVVARYAGGAEVGMGCTTDAGNMRRSHCSSPNRNHGHVTGSGDTQQPAAALQCFVRLLYLFGIYMQWLVL